MTNRFGQQRKERKKEEEEVTAARPVAIDENNLCMPEISNPFPFSVCEGGERAEEYCIHPKGFVSWLEGALVRT